MTSSPSETNPTTTLSAFVTDTKYQDIPRASISTVEHAFLDTVGVTLAGIETSAGKTAADTMAATTGSEGVASVVGRNLRGSAPDIGFVNGTAGHCLDYDDWADSTGGHPSVVLVPAVLAVAELEPVSGEEAITAYTVGFETMAAILAPITPGHYEHGWHTTSTVGTFGATAAAAYLLGLPLERTTAALNAAASMPTGVQANFGTMTKPVHVGSAIRSGLSAALLAREGLTASTDAIGGDEGFWDVYGVDPDRSAFPRPGERWKLAESGIHTKKYPSCGGTHTAIAATQLLCSDHAIAPDDVDSVHVVAAPVTGDALRYDDPATGLQGKFSMPYAVACAIARETIGLDVFSDDAIEDASIRRLMNRVTFEVNRDLPYQSTKATVTVQTSGGEQHRVSVEHAPGSPENPLSDAEYREKFLRCATHSTERDNAKAAADFLSSLREQDDVAGVFDFL